MNFLGSHPKLMRAYLSGKSGKAIFSAMARPGFDVDAFLATQDGQWLMEKFATEAFAPDDSPKIHAYWAERGIVKEVHGRIDRPEGYWSVFIPKQVQANPDRKVPLVFFMHGMSNPIRIMQGMGMVELAARDGFIVVTPQNEQPDYLVDLYRQVVDAYPVDTARVYMIGFSFGSHSTARMAVTHPELFAGVGMGSMPTLGDMRETRITGIDYEPFRHTEEMVGRMAELGMPNLMMLGTDEMLRFLPFYDFDLSYTEDTEENADNHVRFVIDPNTEYDTFNAFRRAAGCQPIDPTEAREKSKVSDSATERMSGLLFESSEDVVLNGRTYHVGHSTNAAGQTWFKLYLAEGMLHLPTSQWAELTWNHLKQFSRDPETKRIVMSA